LIIHLASVWVPFTSESKEAIASYDEIVREIELALHEVGRRLATVLRKENRLEMELQRRTEIERYLPHVGDALSDLLGWNDDRRDEAVAKMDTIVHRTRKAKQS
jgi:DNA topoisomerase-6 subunit B